MFGKRNKPEQNQDDQFEAGEFGSEFSGNDDFADDSWDPENNGGEEGLDVAPQARRSSPLSKLLPWAALGVIGAGAAGYFYLNNPMMTSAPAADTQVVAAAPEAPAADIASPPADVTPQPTEQQAEPAPVVVEETTPIPATEATVAAAEPEVKAPVVETPAPAKVEAVVAPVETPVVTATPAMAAPVVTAPVVAAPVEATPAPAALPAALTQRLDVLEHQITDLSKVVDRAATARPAATENKAQSEKIAALEATVRQLQKEVAALKAAPARESSPTPPVAEIAKPAVTETKPVAEVAKPAVQASKPATPAPAKVSWILRAAQNGEAWISPSIEGDITHVIIGQNVRGLGKVTAIRSVNGKWEVVGTQGSIRQ